MIITKKKPYNEILDALDMSEKIVILGCSECAAMCKTGGEEEVQVMKEALEAEGYTVLAAEVLTTACNNLLDKKEMKALREQLEAADAVLSLSCGNGVQTVAHHVDKPVIPGTNTLFVGEKVRAGIFEENCRTCGQCVLGRTAAVCPVSRCAKGLLNGACGGSTNGKCEVNPDEDCAWVLIYNRLKELDQLEALEKIYPLRSYLDSSHPRSLNLKKGQK